MFKALIFSTMITLSTSFACGSISPVEIVPHTGVAPDTSIPTTTTVVIQPTSMSVSIPQPPVDLIAATRYALRTLPAREVLLEVMGGTRFNHLAPKLMGESRWNCGINNPRSSAAGLGQTLYNVHRERTLASHWLGPFTWADVRGPDCLADAILIDILYDGCGLGPWTPPYDCLRPLPRV